jgi:hypothetical protein
MERRFFQCLKERIRHIRSHAICGGQDTDTALALIGSVSEIPLHLPHLAHLEGLAFWLED